MKMKRMVITALMALFAIGLWAQAPGQGKPRFDPKEFQQRMEAELTRQAGLTPEEARAFFPIYKEMKEKQRNIGVQIHRLKKECQADEAAYAATIAKIKQLQVESAQLEQNYYKRLVEAVPASKVFKVMKAEDDFHRRMVQGGQRKHQGNRQREGQRQSYDWQRPIENQDAPR